jgi:hypothetical protein
MVLYGAALYDHENPGPPEYPVLYETDWYKILNVDNTSLILEWKAEGQRLDIAESGCPPLTDAAIRMRDYYIGGF